MFPLNHGIEILFWTSLFLIFYTYVLYPALLTMITAGKAKGGSSYPGNGVEPELSFIVSAYNEETVIREKLENTLALDYPKSKLEVIIASDGSTDRTDDIVREYAAKGIRLVRYDERSGKVNVLNRVIPAARGGIVVLSDANTMYEPGALRRLVKRFETPRVGCVCGKLVLKAPDGSVGGEMERAYWKYENYLKEREGLMGALLGANGGIYAFRRTLFKPLRPNVIVEDFIIPMDILANGYQVVYEPLAVAYEYTSKNLTEEQVRRVRIAAGSYQALFMTLPMMNFFKGFSAFAYVSHKVIRWLAPFLMVSLGVTNLLLPLDNLVYLVFAVMQATLYAVSFAGYATGKTINRYKLFLTAYYFVSMNWCLLMGFMRFVMNRQKVTWQRVER